MIYSALALERRILSFPYNHSIALSLPDTRIQNCVRIAILIYTNTTLLNNIPLYHLRRLLPTLRPAQEKMELEVFWAPFGDLLLWGFCMGTFVAEGSSDEFFFTGLMKRTADFLLISEWTELEELEELLGEFFYLKRVHEEGLRRIWGKG
jgi:hypothetical protein